MVQCLVLATAYKIGLGVDKDEREASWSGIGKAALLGDAMAMVQTGDAYKAGQGVDEDEREAVKWYRNAANTGLPLGINRLAYAYKYGQGVDHNLIESVNLFRKSAELGNTRAMIYLGDAYRDGQGVTVNRQEALNWYRKASQSADKQEKEAAERRMKAIAESSLVGWALPTLQNYNSSPSPPRRCPALLGPVLEQNINCLP